MRSILFIITNEDRIIQEKEKKEKDKKTAGKLINEELVSQKDGSKKDMNEVMETKLEDILHDFEIDEAEARAKDEDEITFGYTIEAEMIL